MQGQNLVLKALNTSLKYSSPLCSCTPLCKENPKARREMQRRPSGKSNKGLNTPYLHPQNPVVNGSAPWADFCRGSSADQGKGGREEEEI